MSLTEVKGPTHNVTSHHQDILAPTEPRVVVKTNFGDEYLFSRFYKKYVAEFANTPLGNLHNRLVQPFLENPTLPDLANSTCQIATPKSPERQNAAEVVNYTYNVRYVEDRGRVVLIDLGDEDPGAQTIVVTQKIGDSPVVLGTLRMVAGENLEAFELFQMTEGHWPHLQNPNHPLIPGEVGRLGFHPLLDYLAHHSNAEWQLSDRTCIKQQILRQLWCLGTQVMREKGVDIIYSIASRGVFRFVTSAGIRPTEIREALPSNSPEARSTRNEFSGYWKPGGSRDEQPKIHTTAWDLEQMSIP